MFLYGINPSEKNFRKILHKHYRQAFLSDFPFFGKISEKDLTSGRIWSILLYCIIMDMYVFQRFLRGKKTKQKPLKFSISVEFKE